MIGRQTNGQQIGKRNTLKVEQQPGVLLLMTYTATLIVTTYHLTGK